MSNIQDEIVKSDASNLLVSAGAGSGKTTTMIKRIADLILNQNIPVENFLVVTFTVLAASEMKERLIAKFKEKLQDCEDKEKERILSIIEKVKTSSIDTIDGFNSKTIKKYFYKLGISPNIEIISDSAKDYYLSKAMRKTIKDFEKNTEEVHLMLDLFCGDSRSLRPLQDLVLEAYYKVINLKNYEQSLIEFRSNYVDSLKSEKVVVDYIVKRATNLKSLIIQEISSFTNSVQNKLKDFVLFLDSFNSMVDLKFNLNILNKLNVLEFTKEEKKENLNLKELEKEIKKFIEIKNNLQKNQINEDFDIKNEEILKYFDIFVEILNNFIKNYNNLKKKNNLIDFNDLNRLMLELLNNEDIRVELQNKFSYIFIDEYQDVNPLQDELVSMLTTNKTKLFMVGDVKQSIYGFRGASPEWFLKKYNKFKDNENLGVVYDMNANYRSNPVILQFINEVFSTLMTKNSSDINYVTDAMIEPMREDIVDEKVKLMFVQNKRERNYVSGLYSVKENENNFKESENEEALVVAKIITDLIGTEFYDANLKSVRKLTYKDIAILSRSEKDESAKELISLLKELNIPLNVTNKLDNENEVIKLIVSILKCVGSIGDDVDYLSFFLSLTDMDINEVVEIRNKEFSFIENLKSSVDNYNVQNGFEVLKDLKNYSYVSTNSELIRYILNVKGLKNFILQKQNGEKQLSVIDEFVNKITSMEDSLSLCEFVEVVETSVTQSDFSSSDNEDSVTLQTIHKSKGLEYPVVILYNSSKLFSFVREHGDVNFDEDLGFGFDYFDTGNRIKNFSLNKFAIDIKNREKGYKEELRLLYVALTRAKNKLFITGTYSKTALKDKDFSKNSYGNMLLSVFANRLDSDFVELKNCTIELIENVEVDLLCQEENMVEFENCYEGFNYFNKDKFKIPFKNSVTALNLKNIEEQKFNTYEQFNLSTQYEITENKTQVGTHYHSALEQLDFENEYLKNTDFEDVDYNKIQTAHKVLSHFIAGAISIRKEADFEMFVSYSELVNSPIDDKVLVQGVVDLIVERENCVDIVDYKFSNLKIETLKRKYSEQLELYKKAVEYAYNKPVNTFIYSINTGELK